jgi:hypothetical protein
MDGISMETDNSSNKKGVYYNHHTKIYIHVLRFVIKTTSNRKQVQQLLFIEFDCSFVVTVSMEIPSIEILFYIGVYIAMSSLVI